jgi:hypothetical protein
MYKDKKKGYSKLSLVESKRKRAEIIATVGAQKQQTAKKSLVTH